MTTESLHEWSAEEIRDFGHRTVDLIAWRNLPN